MYNLRENKFSLVDFTYYNILITKVKSRFRLYFLRLLCLNKSMESEENIYSKEFIERLNNQSITVDSSEPRPKAGPSLWIKIAIGAGLLLMLGVMLMLNAMADARARERIALINNLSTLSNQTHEVTKKYQNNINDTEIRVVNEHFFQSLFGLNNAITNYTNSVYDKEQLKTYNAEIKNQKASLQEIFDRLHKADLNEALARTYIQELTSLLDQIITALQKAIWSGYYNQDFTSQLKNYYEELLKVQNEITTLEEKRAKSRT